jgi:hypothetical protein
MRITVVAFLLLSLGAVAGLAATAAPAPEWPSLDRQLAAAKVVPGTALERLIRDNQDFQMLRPDERRDHRGLPPWLRVYWRKGHPELVYSASDPTGGYPYVLKEILEWMVSHQELRPSSADEPAAPEQLVATAGGNLRVSGAQTSPRSESAIAISRQNTNRIIGACNNISASGQQAQFFSTDGGATWGQSFLPLVGKDSFHSDPAVDWTSDGTAWSTTIGIHGNSLGMRAYKSIDGGATWTFDATFSGKQHATDKDMMWVDHSSASPFRDQIYAIWHDGRPAFVNRRTGPAGSWQTPIQVSGGETLGTAIGGDIKTNGAGDVFAFWPATGNSRIIVAKSTDGGASFGVPNVIATTSGSFDIGIPAMDSRRALIYVAAGAFSTSLLNNVYASWTDLTGAAGCNLPADEPGANTSSPCKIRIWFARSTNGGVTWSVPVMLNNQPSLNDQFNQWLTVDENDGRIGVIYYDTVNDPSRLKTDVWYQSSSDGGVTWSAAVKVTTAETNETVAGADSGNQYGDYNGLSGFLGKFFPSWTDRRDLTFEEIWTAPISDP